MNRLNQLLALSTAFLTISCGAQYTESENQAYYQTSNASGNTSEAGEGLRKVSFNDRENNNMPAYTLALPASYAFEGNVYWETQAGIYVPNAHGQAYNQATKTGIVFFPSVSFKSQSGPNYAQYTQMMGNTGGDVRMMPTDQAIEQIVLPYVRSQKGNINIEGGRSIPNLEKQLWPQDASQAKSDGFMYSYTYQADGETYKAELYAVRFAFDMPVSGSYGQDMITRWGLGRIFEISAPASTFDREKAELMQIVKSVKTNPEWQALCRQIDRQKAREIDNMAANSAAQHQNRMRQNQDAFDATQRAHSDLQNTYDQGNQAWMNNQRTIDAGHQNSVNSIHGYENYTDPNTGDNYTLDNPNKYNWTNGNGEVISTDDAFYNPERYNSGSYYQLDPR
ncbi:MAG: hypothetical protein ABR574_13615 [Cryomorphaceae bacterium]|nr:hypothetical protein [Flavobacteriales bacterium]